MARCLPIMPSRCLHALLQGQAYHARQEHRKPGHLDRREIRHVLGLINFSCLLSYFKRPCDWLDPCSSLPSLCPNSGHPTLTPGTKKRTDTPISFFLFPLYPIHPFHPFHPHPKNKKTTPASHTCAKRRFIKFFILVLSFTSLQKKKK